MSILDPSTATRQDTEKELLTKILNHVLTITSATGAVDSVTAGDSTIAIGGTAVDPTVRVGTITKNMVGLGSVDNTSDANKPVSTAQGIAIGAKLDASQKGAVNGVPTLNASQKVVEDPANAQTSAANSKIPIAPASGDPVLANGFLNLKTQVTDLSSNDIKALVASPKTIVDAPVAGRVRVLVSVAFHYKFVSADYTTLGTTDLLYEYTTGNVLIAQVNSTGVFSASGADKHSIRNPIIGTGGTVSTVVPESAIQFKKSATELVNGDSTLKIVAYYVEHAVA